MEIEGHPTQDLIEELERRGALRMSGSTSGPHPDALKFLEERVGNAAGQWMFLATEVYMTGFDEVPQ